MKHACLRPHVSPPFFVIIIMIMMTVSLLFHPTSCYTQPEQQPHRETEYWRRLQPLTNNNARLRNFAESVWHANLGNPAPNRASTATGQQCDAPYPGLVPARPFHDLRDLRSAITGDSDGWMDDITSDYGSARDELHGYLTRAAPDAPPPSDRADDGWSTRTTNLCHDTAGFTTLTIQNADGTPTQIGTDYFTRTLRILAAGTATTATTDDDDDDDSIALAPRPICINRQRPDTGLAPHSDNMNFLLTCHVALIVPRNGVCLFRNFDRERRWRRGEMLIADTSFVHSTVNTSMDESRYVLSFSIWHPALTREERCGILAVHDALMGVGRVEVDGE